MHFDFRAPLRADGADDLAALDLERLAIDG
jgi:hypothetical protein